MEEKIYCSHCGELIDTDDYEAFNGEIYALIAWTITQQSVTAAVQESGAKMPKVMITPAFAGNATTITIPVVKNVTHSFTTMILMSMMMATSAMSATREYAKTQQSTNTVTSLNRFSMVTAIVILVLN